MPTSHQDDAPKVQKGLATGCFPRAHLALAGAITLAVATLAVLLPSEPVEAKKRSLSIQLPPGGERIAPDIALQNPVSAPFEDEQRGTDATTDLKIVSDSADSVNVSTTADDEGNWRPTLLNSGDNLTTAFKRLGLNAQDVYQVANAQQEAAQLARLKPGETLAVAIDNNGQLAQVKYSRSRLEHYLYRREGDAFVGEQLLFQPEVTHRFEQGQIENSLFLDASKAGLSEAKIMELAKIFGWDIDFALDIRGGDQFSVLYEERYFEGEVIGEGAILAASFTNQGQTYEAVLFRDPNGESDYYTPQGKPMRKAFLRAPLDFTRISSNFNLRRKHPIHKRIKAHRGVDYAAPRGTPVYAAGNGKVIASGYHRANGNYVFIQHGQEYVTKYLHLHTRQVRKGQSVKQHQTIGTVGSTGYSTGPHLHYEFLVNGVHRDPRTVKLPEATPITRDLKQQFQLQTAPLLAQLKQMSATQLAMLSDDNR